MSDELLTRALEHLDKNEVDRCLILLQELQAQGGNLHADVHYFEGLCERRRGNRTAALQAFERALQEAPREADYLLEYGLVLIEEKRVQEGLDALRHAVHESCYAPEFRHELYVQNALALYDEGYVDACILSFQKALKFTRRPETYCLMAQILLEQEQQEQALEAIGEGLEHYPDDARMHHLSGLSLVLAQRPYEAARAFMRSYELNRADADPLHSLGICFESMGETERAVDTFERCLRLRLQPEMRADVESRIEKLRQSLQEQQTWPKTPPRPSLGS